jgi:FkbM family methyltransferase
MSLKRTLVNALDRPGGRKFLSLIASVHARLKTGAHVGIFFDGEQWIHRVNGHFFPDGPSFPYYSSSVSAWLDEPDIYFRNAEKYWYKFYHPRPGDIILDIGAGRGEGALPMSRAVGLSGRVVAVEAMPPSFDLLKKLCALNNIRNVLPVHAAVADKSGVMYAQPSPSGHWQMDVVVADRPEGCSVHEVRSLTVDELCSELKITGVAFLKMNIEGAERLALPGAVRTLRKTRSVCISCHDFRADHGEEEHFRTRAFTEQFLCSHGFELRRFAYQYDFERDLVYAIRR